jgi:predicted Ser/Thr protein kinase
MLDIPKNVLLPVTWTYHQRTISETQSIHRGLNVASRMFGSEPDTCNVTNTGWMCTYDASKIRHDIPSRLLYGMGSAARLPSRGRVMVKIVAFRKRYSANGRHAVGPVLEVLYGDGYVHEYASRHLAKEGMVPELYFAGVHPIGYFVSVMEFIDGVPLYDDYFGGKIKSPIDTSSRAAEIATIVKRLLRAGVMHHDLHWWNVLVRRENGRACVIDFGESSFIRTPPWIQRTLNASPNVNILSPAFLGKYHTELTPLANAYMLSKNYTLPFYHPMIEIVAFLRSVGNK